jgi:hypothetical protein
MRLGSSVLVLLSLFGCTLAESEGSSEEGSSEEDSSEEGANEDDSSDDGSSDEGSSDDGSSDDDSSDDDSSDDGSPDSLPPIDADALLPWLEGEPYLIWAAESGPHVSAGPHGSAVRTFFNAALAEAAAAGADEYPIGAATVKELFDGSGERSGWAVMVKLELGQGGDGWYWYESVGASVYADGTGVALCTGCHSSAVDFVRTTWPLE